MGTSIYVHEKVAYDAIQINPTELQATAIKLYTSNDTQIDIYNIYNQPKCKYDLKKIKKLIKNNPKSTILLGDFNAHNPLWDFTSNKLNKPGKIIEKLIEELDLCLVNDPEIDTYFPTHTTSIQP